MGKLKVVKAAYAGACYGVQRALDMTLKAAEAGGSVCTLGPLIHNPGVVAELEERGICVADSVDSIDADGVVIRSHGVVPQVIDDIEQRGFTVIDATCPHVMRAQRAAAKLAKEGRHVLVVGEAAILKWRESRLMPVSPAVSAPLLALLKIYPPICREGWCGRSNHSISGTLRGGSRRAQGAPPRP